MNAEIKHEPVCSEEQPTESVISETDQTEADSDFTDARVSSVDIDEGCGGSGTGPSARIQAFEENDLTIWRKRTFWQDITQSWQNKFVEFACKVTQIRKENLLELSWSERAANLYSELQTQQTALKSQLKTLKMNYVERDVVKDEIKRMTRAGVIKYGLQLCVVEITTLSSIIVFKLMIEYLKEPEEYSKAYAVALFCLFAGLRMLTIVSRCYYDMHVYNYFRFVQTKIQCWLFEMTCSLRQWQIRDEKKAQVVNILTKDIDIFVGGSWQFPYLVTVPINTVISAVFLFQMYGAVVLLCYLAMAGLLLMQYCTNKYIAKVQLSSLKFADQRIQLMSQVLKGIRTIKCRLLEPLYAQRIDCIRSQELKAFSRYCDVKNGCGAIYYNSGVIISAFVFLLADKETLELGKVFSTLALLGYIFNFSILYSNYAIESLYALSVFTQRIEQVITGPLLAKDKTFLNRQQILQDDGLLIHFKDVSASWKVPQGKDLFTGEESDPEDDSSVLRSANFKLYKGDKVAVVGTVGAGKSSLLMAILGEMPVHDGTLFTDQSQQMTLAEQEPLIVTGTVESNILFGLEREEEWYQKVLWACCLKEDLLALPSGDQTKLGEMGQILSGGQKSRISLARALYRKSSSIMLIDGTLGSLDQKTSKKVMERAVLGLCADKLVVFVTHDLNQAAQMNSVIVLRDKTRPPQFLTREEFVQNLEDLRGQLYSLKDGPTGSLESTDEGFNGQQVIQEEEIEVGKVKWKHYREFFKFAFGGLWGMLLIVVVHVVINLCTLSVSLYLAFTLTNKFKADAPSADQSQANYNLVLSAIVIMALLFSILGKFASNKIFMGINRRLHDQATRRVLNTGIAFFEENTQGLILNRFSKDVATLDNLVFCVLEMADYSVKCFITLMTVMIVSPWLMIVVCCSTCFLLRIRERNLRTTRDTMRLKFALMSPVNSLIQDAINALPTLRCLRQKSHFLNEMFRHTDLQTSAHITSSGCNRWTAFRIDCQAYLISVSFAMIAIFFQDPHRSMAQLALTAIGLQMTIEITRQFDMAIRWSVKLENDMVVIQRLLALANLPAESAQQEERESGRDNQLQEGKIEFARVEMRYKPELKPALKNLSFLVEPGAKVAVVGRTGAGKSSLYQLLLGFRSANKGALLIDDRDVSHMQLSQLRSEINVVLQNPFIVPTDTIRENLDPRRLCSDRELEAALSKAALDVSKHSAAFLDQSRDLSLESDRTLMKQKTVPGSLSLNTMAGELSIGQQQLLNLAHAMLQKSCRILLLDEPTAQVDVESQKKVLTNLFEMCTANKVTVLMIAHRLETAATYCDKVLVLDKGTVIQYDEVAQLNNSYFCSGPLQQEVSIE